MSPAVELLAYSHQTGYGVLDIDGVGYAMRRITDEDGRTIGMKLCRLAEEPGKYKHHAIDFTAEHGWACDCEDATYRPYRPGGCKHVVALRQVAAQLRCTRAAQE